MKRAGTERRNTVKSVVRTLASAFCVMGMVGSSAAALDEKLEAQRLIDLARVTVETIRRNPDFEKVNPLLDQAKAALIIPNFVKAGFIFGGQAGSGVLLRRKHGTDDWGYPAFYKIGGGSVGLQIGVESAEILFLIMTESGLNSLLTNRVKLGADMSVALGTLGAGLEAGKTAVSILTDVYSFSVSKGVFAGISFSGAVIFPDTDRNRAYYGRPVTATEIVKERAVKNPSAESLREALARQ